MTDGAAHLTGHGRVRRTARDRPMTRLGTAGLGAHVFLELAAGVGMPGASVLGSPAAVLWALGLSALWRGAATRPASGDTTFALWNSVGLAAVLAHFAGWPTRRTRAGLPWLRDCEGLGPGLMPVYNPILYVSAVATVVALIRENRTASRHWALPAVGLVPVLVAAQRIEHRRLVTLAYERPAWWNRRLR
jgi:hypothetical protein